MTARWIGQYAVAAVICGVLDGLWLGWIGKPLYDAQLGHLLAERPNWRRQGRSTSSTSAG